MKSISRAWGVTLWLALAFTAAVAAEAPAGLRAVVNEEGCTIHEGDLTVLHYQSKPVMMPDGKRMSSHFVHPVAGLDGETITDLFPQDHIHHRAIFWSWPQFTIAGEKMGDPWLSENIVWENMGFGLANEEEDGSAGFMTSLLWKTPLWREGSEPVVRERVFIHVYPVRDEVRVIDFTIRLQALVPELRIGGSTDVKGYGGFCARVLMPKEAVFTGREGKLAPRTEGLQAGPWINLAGTIDGKPWAFAILQHPNNPGHPQPTLLRDWYDTSNCQNAIWPGREPVLLPTEKPIVLKYRLLIHRNADPAAAWAAYAAQP